MPTTKEECGHINKQNWQYKEELDKSVLEDLACDLEKGHEGNHSAEKFEKSFKNDGLSTEGMVRVEWSDAAGTPADEIEPDLTTLPPHIYKAMMARKAEEERRHTVTLHFD